MNTRFVIRSLIAVLALSALVLAAASFLPAAILRAIIFLWLTRPPDPTPPPPAITAPRGELPAGPGGLLEWAQYADAAYAPTGSGFLLRLHNGTVIGVTTSHSVGDIGDPSNGLQHIAFGVAGREGFIVEFERLYGEPGIPRTGDDMTVDYVLLKLSGTVDPALVLTPDARGAPQPGERVALFSGLGDGLGGRRILEGTVQSVAPQAAWALMDGREYPAGMSGSPLVSQHTGQVVGMAIATAPRATRYMIGFHPIASIVQKAEAASTFPRIADYRR